MLELKSKLFKASFSNLGAKLVSMHVNGVDVVVGPAMMPKHLLMMPIQAQSRGATQGASPRRVLNWMVAK